MIYTVELPEGARSLVYDGKTKFVVSASSSASALALAKAASSADLDAVWDNADVTEIAPDLEGVTFELVVGNTGTVEVVAAEGDTFADVAAALVTALEKYAGTPFTNPSWTLDTPYSGKLIVDDGTGGIGSEEVTLTVTAADGETDLTSLFVGDVVDESAGLDNQISVDLEGYVFSVQVGSDDAVTYKGVKGDTLDDVGTGLKTALNAVAGKPYSATWTLEGPLYGHLEVDDGTGSIGDSALTVGVTDPAKADVSSSFVGTTIDQDAGLTNDVALDLSGYTFTLNVGAKGEVVVVAAAGDDIDDVGGDLVTALGAVDGAPYKNPTWTPQGDLYGTLLVDDGSGGIGNLELSLVVEDADTNVVTTSFKGKVVDQGIAAGDAVSVDLMAGVLTTLSKLSVDFQAGKVTTTDPLSLRLSIGTDEVVID